MSLDLYLQTEKRCSACGREGSDLWWRNYTHNGMSMWKKAGVLDAFYESDGHQAKEYIEVLESGLRYFCENFEEMEQLNSPNGWGLAKYAIGFLSAAYFAFRENPEAFIQVSR